MNFQETEKVALKSILQEDIKLGISVCRNPHLANVFYRLQLIEAYGSGIKKIMDSYLGKWKQPSIICSNNAFKIVLPNTTSGRILKTMVNRGQIIKLGGSLTTRYRAIL